MDITKYTEIFRPVVAIVAYKGEAERDQEWYLESHPIEDGQMMEGRPMQQDTLHGMLELMYNKNQEALNMNRFLPGNLLYYNFMPGGDYKLVWFRPEEQRFILFSKGLLELPNATAWVPPMIYVASRKTLSVFALKTNDRPEEDTQLYRAPYHNVSPGGTVCLGSAKAKKPKTQSLVELIRYHEDLFWLSEFTHMQGGNFTKSPGNTLWKKLLKDNSIKWTLLEDELLKSVKPEKVGDLLK